MNYLVTIWDAGGSVPPELALARRLVAAGHRVVVLAGPPLQPAVIHSRRAGLGRVWSRRSSGIAFSPTGKDTTMKLIWAGCIFGAGYVLGRPEGRAKLAELLQRPEVTQLKQPATSTASTAVKTSRQQLSTATQKIKDNALQKRAGTSTDASAAVTDTGSRRRLRLPQFARQGVRSDGSVVPVAGPVATATQTATPNTSASSTPIRRASASLPGEGA